MAVTRVFGRVDGVEVVMEQTAVDRWSVPVPLDLDGEYVVEVIAEDGAGNRSYLARMLFCVDSSRLYAHVIPLRYFSEVIPDRYQCMVIEPVCCGYGGV